MRSCCYRRQWCPYRARSHLPSRRTPYLSHIRLLGTDYEKSLISWFPKQGAQALATLPGFFCVGTVFFVNFHSILKGSRTRRTQICSHLCSEPPWLGPISCRGTSRWAPTRGGARASRTPSLASAFSPPHEVSAPEGHRHPSPH